MKKSAVIFLLATLVLASTAHAALTPVDLRCDSAVNPLGVDSPNPRLSWKLAGGGRGQRQTAYQIMASTSGKEPQSSDGWDSGKVESDETIQIPFPGENLRSSEQIFWKVRVWDESGQVSKWSKTAKWTMGVLDGAEWQAKWIGAAATNFPSLLLRREFIVKSRFQLKRALVNVCGLGQYELMLNGKKVGDDFLSPGWTKYDRTCLYDTRDITAELKEGKNAVGICLGNGMYNVFGVTNRFTKFKGSFGPQKAIAQIRLEYEGGWVQTIGTDESWRVAPSPITFSSIYGGEDFDARLVQKGWDKINFDDSGWSPAQIVNGPGGELKGFSCAAPPIRAFQVHPPVATRALTNGDIVFDLGQNAAHVLQIRVAGPAGGKVRLFPAELTNNDGSISQGSMGAGRRGAVWCEFTKATGGVESWSPKFFYVGCRYVQAHFTPATTNGELPKIKSLAGIVVHSSSEPAGEFECSNDLFNRIRTLVRWAQMNNMASLMTDCPHRERLGWLEEDHLNGPSLRYEFDLAQLFAKQMNDIADSQLTNGLVPDIAPEYTVFKEGFRDSPEWGSACILVPWQQYEFDGDLPLLQKHYDLMKRYAAHLASGADTNNILNHGLGDWYDRGPKTPGLAQLTPISLTATAFYFYDTWILAQTASLLGKADEAKQFSDQAAQIRDAFNEKFFNPANGSYSTGSQTANAIPLVMNLCEPANRAAVLDAIVRDVRAHTNSLTAGDVGYRYLLRALADGGRSDVIFDMNNQSENPGYGLQLKKGATSLTEAWDARRGSSQDHFMLGQIQEWFYHDLAGIQNAPGSAGFKKIVINPQPVGDVTWTRASFNSVRGKIVSDWKRDGDKFILKVTIPANTTATVFIPANSADEVLESGQPAAHSQGVNFLRMENGRAVFEIESGDYNFQSAD